VGLQWKLVDPIADVSEVDVRCIGVGYVDAGETACVDVDVRSLSIAVQRSRRAVPFAGGGLRGVRRSGCRRYCA
jgi:hypothetical protein